MSSEQATSMAERIARRISANALPDKPVSKFWLRSFFRTCCDWREAQDQLCHPNTPYGPKRVRYSAEMMNALTISASTKLP